MGGTGGMGTGDCCPDGNCLCHGPDPTALTGARGSFTVDEFELTAGTVFYPTDAEPPFAAIAICPGFINSGPEMRPWGDFYASHGFVLIATHTLGTDFPDVRATKLAAAVAELKTENDNSSSPIFGQLSGRYGTSGYSMGGGGTTIAATADPTLMTSIGLAAWGPVGEGVTVPTLFLCGESDGTAPCSGSEAAYGAMPDTTDKMLVTIPATSHFEWFDQNAGNGRSGEYALAFQKVFLAGDERWRPLLLENPPSGSMTTNIE
jgi:pimeloyl-ACP methyl ester carboxylesterase